MEKVIEYGRIGIITHFALSSIFLGCTYLIVCRSKNPQNIIKYFKLEKIIPEKAGSFVIASIIHKAAMPIRLAVSALAIPLVIKLLGED